VTPHASIDIGDPEAKPDPFFFWRNQFSCHEFSDRRRQYLRRNMEQKILAAKKITTVAQRLLQSDAFRPLCFSATDED
jgi:hypothetical protein